MKLCSRLVFAVVLLGWPKFQQVSAVSVVSAEKVNVINISDWTAAAAANVDSNDYEGDTNEKKVVVGVLLPRHFPHPDDLAHYSRLDSVLPAVVLATQELQKLLPGWSWDILVGDTECNSTTGPLQAVDMYYKNRYPAVKTSISSYLILSKA